jgi:Vacuolar sorting protein 9 (VPS9) domain
MSHTRSTVVDRKCELLTIARRSRIKWIRSADDCKTDSQTFKNVPNAVPKKAKSAVPSVREESSTDTFQKTFDFLTDVIADGENVDLDSLIYKGENNYYDDFNFDEDKDHTDKDSQSSSPSTEEKSIENYTYTTFLQALCSRKSVGFVKSLQQFVSKFESRSRIRAALLDEKLNQEEALRGAESIWAFLEFTTNEMQQSPDSLWNGEDTERRILTRTYVEKFVFNKLYSATFHSSYEDYFLNEKLWEHIASLSFLRPEHLDIKTLSPASKDFNKHLASTVGNESKWWLEYIEEAVLNLQQLQFATCPEDKVNCIKKTSVAIEKALHKNAPTTHSSIPGSSPSSSADREEASTLGADDVLPLLILCVKESNPLNLHSELKYLQTYMDPSQAYGEAGYLLTQLASAVNFLETVDAGALTISSDEFKKSQRKFRETRVNFSQPLGEDRAPVTAPLTAAAVRGSSRVVENKRDLIASKGLRTVTNTNGNTLVPDTHRAVSQDSKSSERSLSLSLFELYKSRQQR